MLSYILVPITQHEVHYELFQINCYYLNILSKKITSSEKSLSNLIQRIDNEKATLVITIFGITTTHREH